MRKSFRAMPSNINNRTMPSNINNNNGNNTNITNEIRVLDEKGHEAYSKGNMEDALLYYRERVELTSSSLSQRRELASSHKNIGLILHDKGDTEGSIRELETALEIQNSILNNEKDDKEERRPTTTTLEEDDDKNDINSTPLSFSLEVANTHLNLAEVLCVVNRLQEALDHADLARKIQFQEMTKQKQQQNHKQRLQLSSLSPTIEVRKSYRKRLSTTVSFSSETTTSSSSSSSSTDAVTKSHKFLLAKTYSIIGEIFSRAGNYKMALDYHSLGCEIYTKYCPKTITYSCSASNVGLILYKMGKFESAYQQYLKPALEVEKTAIPNTLDLADSYSNVGEVLFRLERYDEALSNFQRALELKSIYDKDSLNLCKTHGDIGWTYHRLGNEEEKAQEHFSRAIDLEEHLIPNSDHLAQTYLMLVCSLKAQNKDATQWEDKMNRILLNK